jgi:2-polyprenyl-3-methyl-5-hydroxy-6-metoxy-1,4-benzoquinol methylase
MIQHYVDAYKDLMEHPDRFANPRFQLNDRHAMWFVQGMNDVIWKSRQERYTPSRKLIWHVKLKPLLRKMFFGTLENTKKLKKSRATQTLHPNFFSSWPKPVRRGLRYAKYHLLIPAIKRASLLLFGYDIGALGERINQLDDRVRDLYRIMDLFSENPEYMWLYRNRSERMDATIDIFDKGRRDFHLARYQFACTYVEGKKVADIACGTGYGSQILITEGKAVKVIGVDIDKQAIAYAAAKHMPEGAKFICASGDKTDIADQAIDVVVSFETLEHVPSDEALLREFHRILKPGGILICSVPNNWPLNQTPHHVRVYDRHSFESILSRYFVNLQLYNQNSGTISDYNHGQPQGTCKTDSQNQSTAECYIAVCNKPK